MPRLRMKGRAGLAQPPAVAADPSEQEADDSVEPVGPLAASGAAVAPVEHDPLQGEAGSVSYGYLSESAMSQTAAIARLEQRLGEWMAEVMDLIKKQHASHQPAGWPIKSSPQRSRMADRHSKFSNKSSTASSLASSSFMGPSMSAKPMHCRHVSLNPHVVELHQILERKNVKQGSQGAQEAMGQALTAPGTGSCSGFTALQTVGERPNPSEEDEASNSAAGAASRRPTASQQSMGSGNRSQAPTVRSSVSRTSNTAEDLESRWANMKRRTLVDRPFNFEKGVSRRLAVALVSGQYFTTAIIASVLLNTLLLAAQVQHEAVSDEPSDVFMYLEYCFVSIFTFEQVVKVFAFRSRLYRDIDRYWNAFDMLIVLCSWADIVIASFTAGMQGTNATVAKLLKLPRLARVLRMCRTARFFGSLRVMVLMIMRSFLSLVWVIVVIFGILFFFSLLLTQGVTEYFRSASTLLRDASAQNELIDCFGSLFQTMYSLSQAMTGGRNWGEYAKLLALVGWDAVVILVMFIFFTAFSVVNIVTGVFVDGAIEMSRSDRMLMTEKKMQQTSETAGQLLELLIEMDSDQNGNITYDEFMLALERRDVQDFLAALDINPSQASTLFQVFDANEDGEVDIVEFVDGMSLLKGEAKSSDIQILLMHVRTMVGMIRDQHEAVKTA